MVEEARDVIARAKSGERFDEDYVKLLKDSLEAEAGDQGGKEVADALREMQRSWLNADINEASDRLQKSKSVSEFYLNYLRERLKAIDK